MCPGLAKVCSVDRGSANAWMVYALSWVETPVVHPSFLSTVTVKGVPKSDVLLLT